MKWFTGFIENKKLFYNSFGFMEKFAKKVLYDCQHCDDCALFDMYYLCPVSQCPKDMRQGPCGGSRVDGTCEVHEDQMCIWDRVYWRAKNRKGCDKLRYIMAPRDWELYETNSWVNYFQKHDHSAKELAIPEADGPSACD
jgi:methylenetetrahydrofolate reductase (NADPH)